MKKLWISITLCGFFAIPLKAQDYPRAEVYGGYQLSLDADSFLGDEGTCLSGFAAAGEFNIKSYFGIVGELGYERSTFVIQNVTSHRSRTTLLAGPRFGNRGERVRIFGHVLMGLNHEAGEYNWAGHLSENVSTNNFALAVGGGLDVSLGKIISIRPFQLDVISSRHERRAGSDHKNLQLRYTGGIIIKLGAIPR